MSVYARFKRQKDGFRALIELLETTPPGRRQKMIDVGMQEDSDYTLKALQYVMSFEDIIKLPNMELAEVLAVAVPRTMAIAISSLDAETQTRFLQNAQTPIAVAIKEHLGIKAGPSEVQAAQLKIVGNARELEKKGVLRIKKIPPQ